MTSPLIDHSIGPVSEANHVWLVSILVVWWIGLPRASAAGMTSLPVPLLLTLFLQSQRWAQHWLEALAPGGGRWAPGDGRWAHRPGRSRVRAAARTCLATRSSAGVRSLHCCQ